MDSSASNSDNSNTIVVTTVQACIEAVASVEEDGKVPIVLCTGSDDPQSGVSWCPDCVTGKFDFLLLGLKLCSFILSVSSSLVLFLNRLIKSTIDSGPRD